MNCTQPWKCVITEPHCDECLVNLRLMPCDEHDPDLDDGYVASKVDFEA